MRAIGYVRVSTEGQAADGVSLDAQRAKMEAWALANDAELAHVFADKGFSGGRVDTRDGLQAALQEACNTGAALVVYSLSRLSRSTRDTLAIAERLDRAGADLVSMAEKIDTTSAAGKMVFRLLAVLNEFERDQISERTRAAMMHLKSNGKRAGTIPFGYSLARDGTTLEEVPQERRAIRLMLRLRGRGLPLRKIAERLAGRGIVTKSGKSAWSPQAIKLILDRETGRSA